MIICLKDISEECVLFKANVNAILKFLWAFGGTQALGHSEGTHQRHMGTWLLEGHSGT